MKIKWLGHAAFLLTASDGTRIVTDPYVPGCFDGAVRYGAIEDACDGVTVSHGHDDHCGHRGLPGNPALVRGAGEHRVGSVSIRGVSTWHDADGGRQRGDNTVFVYEMDGLMVCHLGDLGHVLDEATAADIGRVDVLLVPVGGRFTIDADEATRVAGQLGARVIVPMHFKTGKLGFDVAGVDDFLAGKPNVRLVGGPEAEVTADTLPAEPTVWVLEHAR